MAALVASTAAPALTGEGGGGGGGAFMSSIRAARAATPSPPPSQPDPHGTCDLHSESIAGHGVGVVLLREHRAIGVLQDKARGAMDHDGLREGIPDPSGRVAEHVHPGSPLPQQQVGHLQAVGRQCARSHVIGRGARGRSGRIAETGIRLVLGLVIPVLPTTMGTSVAGQTRGVLYGNPPFPFPFPFPGP